MTSARCSEKQRDEEHDNKIGERKMRKLSLLQQIFVSLSVLVLMSASGFATEPGVKDPLLRGNWKEVCEILEKDDGSANNPVHRFLMAHACLATNRNNASLMLFLSLKEKSHLDAWSQWTDSIRRDNSDNAVALYLAADALARQGKLSEAITMLTQALQLKKDFALAYNARGVLRVLTDDQNNALMDFLCATRNAPDLADAYANLGTYYVLIEASGGGVGERGAVEAFNTAIGLNPESALAYNGLGCAYFGNGEFDSAAQAFCMATKLSPVLVTAEINQGFASAYASKLLTLASVDSKPGMSFESLSKQYPSLVKNQEQRLLKMLPPSDEQKFWGTVDNFSHLDDNELKSLVKEYGVQKVELGAHLKMQQAAIQIAQAPRERRTTLEKIYLANRLFPFVPSSTPMTQNVETGWEHFITPTLGYWDRWTALSQSLDKYSSVPASSNKNVTLYITDFGINQWRPGLKTGDDFSQKRGVVSGIQRVGQILIVMPDDREFKRITKEELTSRIFESMKSRVDGGLASKNRHFELQLVQNINTWGYFDKDRQNMVNDFGECAYKAIGMLNDYLKGKGFSTYNYSVAGSNGTKVLTENVGAWKSYLNKADLFDGRALEAPTTEAINTLSARNVRIFNTAGDHLAPNFPFLRSIGNHDVVKDLKHSFPELTAMWLDPTDRLDIVTAGHVAGMDPNSRFVAKVFTGNSYTNPTAVTGRDLLPKVDNLQTDVTSSLMNSIRLRLLDEKIDHLSDLSAVSSRKPSSHQTPSYFTSTDRPLTEVSAMASMVDKGIKPADGLPRSALIVSEDPFRTSLLRSELSKYGFQTKVISPIADPQKVAKDWGADVVLGIRGTTEMKIAGINQDNIDDPSRKYFDSRRIPPPFPPDKGGTAGAGGFPTTRSLLTPNWDWGKPFVLTSVGGNPGGISTKELARSFVDKGNWPVLTSFGLFYGSTSSGAASEEKGGN
jgi:tetratricopeptide (TPR) repeat protein